MTEELHPYLNKYGKNLTEKFKNNDDVQLIIGRDKETRQSIETLLQKYKNNIILVGQPGVGKTALIEGIAQKIARGDVADALKDKEIWEIDLATLTSKDSSDGGFQIRITNLINEIEESGGKIIPFIDEFHTIMGAGDNGALDAANILKPALARGTLRMIGATTLWEYHKYLEKDGAMTRRFRRINLDEPTEEEAISILKGRKRSLEIYHGVTLNDEAIVSAVTLSVRYIQNRFLPDKAIDVLDQAAAATRLSIDSMPEELESLQNKIAGLKYELKYENSTKNINKINDEIRELSPELDDGIKRWREQKEALILIKDLRVLIENKQLKLLNEESKQEEKDLELIASLNKDIQQSEKKLEAFKDSYKKLNPIIDDEVNEETILTVIENLTNIPVSQLTEGEIERMRKLEESLHKRIIGQDEAVKETSYAIKRSRLGLGDPSQPIGSFLFLGPTGVGKAQPATTMIPTPLGYRMLKDIKVNDYVFDRFGNITKVSGKYIQGRLSAYVVELEDGRKTICNEEHLWSFYENESSVLKTDTLKNMLNLNITDVSIPNNEPVDYKLYDFNNLYILPWYILGSGSLYQDLTYAGPKFKELLKSFENDFKTNDDYVIFKDLVKNKSFPELLHNTTLKNRLDLLKGFMDASSLIEDGNLYFVNDDIEIVKSVKKLCHSTGVLTSNIIFEFDIYKIAIKVKESELEKIFNYKLKFDYVNKTNINFETSNSIKIKSIIKSDDTYEMLCIYVENEEHLYLSNDYIVTHNTELVKTLAEYMFGSEDAMIRFDMGEFQDKRSISRLIGAAPGDDINDSGGELTEWAKNKPYSIILFDEAEKANPAIWDLALSLLDDGELTDSRGDRVNFKNTIIILTSNIGSKEILRGFDEKTQQLLPATRDNLDAMLRNSDPDKGGKGFKPEFINRLDSTVIFYPLTREQDEEIATLKLKTLRKRLYNSRKIKLVFSEKRHETLKEDKDPKLDVSYWIANKLTYAELDLGGRPISRYIRKEIEDKLVDLLIDGELKDGSFIYIEATYPPGERLYMGEDGQQRPVAPIIKISEISEDRYNELIKVDPVLLY